VSEHRDRLDALAQALLERETLERREIERLVGGGRHQRHGRAGEHDTPRSPAAGAPALQRSATTTGSPG
jgi:hypothetical protein